jgi:hypothetical protein
MTVGFASESLIIAGAYIYAKGSQTLGCALMSFGAVGSLARFLYRVSKDTTESARKQMIYNDVKSVIASIAQVVYETNSFETKRRNGTPVH